MDIPLEAADLAVIMQQVPDQRLGSGNNTTSGPQMPCGAPHLDTKVPKPQGLAQLT